MRLFSFQFVCDENSIDDLCVRVSALSPDLIPQNPVAQAAVDEALPYDLYCQWMMIRLRMQCIESQGFNTAERQAIAVFVDLIQRVENCYLIKFHENESLINPEQVQIMRRMTIIFMAIEEVLQKRAGLEDVIAVANVLRHLAPVHLIPTLHKKLKLLAKFLFFCSVIAWTVFACVPSMPKQREINFSLAIWVGFASLIMVMNLCMEKLKHPVDRLVSGLMPQMQDRLQSLSPAF
jgi:hypothetical protein